MLCSTYDFFFFVGLEITPEVESGLIFYFGPMIYSPKLGVQDFMALEIQHGYAVLYVDYGTGTIKLNQKQIKLTDGKSHRIDVYWTKTVSDISLIGLISRSCSSSLFF